MQLFNESSVLISCQCDRGCIFSIEREQVAGVLQVQLGHVLYQFLGRYPPQDVAKRVSQVSIHLGY